MNFEVRRQGCVRQELAIDKYVLASPGGAHAKAHNRVKRGISGANLMGEPYQQ